MRKGMLIIAAIFGTLIGYCIVDLLIMPMPFWKFFLIECVITVLHEVYNRAKNQVTINF
jgi:hypothetical protein